MIHLIDQASVDKKQIEMAKFGAISWSEMTNDISIDKIPIKKISDGYKIKAKLPDGLRIDGKISSKIENIRFRGGFGDFLISINCIEDRSEKLLADQIIKQREGEARVAQLREEQKRLTEQQRKEANRLAKLKAATEAKSKELGALNQQSIVNPRVDMSKSIDFGNYHALVIGINRYKNLPPLRTAVADAEAIAGVLKTKYRFSVTSLINPTREQIFDKLDAFRSDLKLSDNLLIYYAGHGILDEKSDEGFWLPVDAKSNLRSQWVSNATITNTLKAIEAKHVMVIADSCYSGRLVRGIPRGIQITERTEQPADYFTKMSRKKTRVVITSGGLEPVEDGRGEHSPFARAILNALNNNDDIIDGSSLFNQIRRPVMLASDQTPQYSDVRRAGHDGGDFLFVRKR